jgi:phosphoglycolate phosphatase-like HAD superfamily hydrolase
VRDAEAAAKVGMAYGAVAWGYHPIETLRSHAAEVFLEPCEIAGKLLGESVK